MIVKCATLLFLLTATGFTQDPARLEQIVQSYVASDHFMGTVLVAKSDQVILSKGYGSADLEWNISNTPATKFRLGSMTKQFTAASILLLEERGKLKIDDPVKKYMADSPAAWDTITIFNLLTHTSGIPNFTSFPDYATSAVPALQRVASDPDEDVSADALGALSLLQPDAAAEKDRAKNTKPSSYKSTASQPVANRTRPWWQFWSKGPR
jgi:CubicO group peptidase (beta-lactamase class C family)